MPAKTFKKAIASVKRPVTCFLGYTTIVSFPTTGRELAIFAPTKLKLLRAVRESFPHVEIDPKRFQRVAYFEQKRITRARRRSAHSINGDIR